MSEQNNLINEDSKKTDAAKNLDTSKKGIELFFGEKERKFFEMNGKELVHGILKESFILYRIDYKKTKTHELYGESKKKVWLPEIEVFGRINVDVEDPKYFSNGGLVERGFGKITAEVYLSHLNELNVKVKMGDFLYHKGHYYEIIDDGLSNISNEHAFGGDKLFFVTIKGVKVNSDVFKAR